MWELKAVGQFVDCVLSVWNCECGQLVITGEMGASQMSPKPRDTNLVLSLVLSRLSGGLGMSLYSPTVYNPPPQLSSPCNLTWIVWLWDVLKINNKMWQELDTFTNTEEKLFWLKPQNHIIILLTCITTLYKVGTHFFLLCKSCLHVFNVLKIHGRKFFWIHSKKMSKH